ncbi:hypothetical protein [Amycolatopsis minnesotensis]|uniref:Uncharacterized protein n=1 Tax=Amycolatopsis minnesotensis TaxID=337894 RepID=A0ABP5EBZ8_9PSEU
MLEEFGAAGEHRPRELGERELGERELGERGLDVIGMPIPRLRLSPGTRLLRAWGELPAVTALPVGEAAASPVVEAVVPTPVVRRRPGFDQRHPASADEQSDDTHRDQLCRAVPDEPAEPARPRRGGGYLRRDGRGRWRGRGGLGRFRRGGGTGGRGLLERAGCLVRALFRLV